MLIMQCFYLAVMLIPHPFAFFVADQSKDDEGVFLQMVLHILQRSCISIVVVCFASFLWPLLCDINNA